MTFSRFAVAVFGFALITGSCAWAMPPQRDSGGQQQDRNWDVTPPEFHELEQRGFRDGIEGARRDFGNHRRPNVNNREEYRHPSLPRSDWEAYQRGFRRGYEQGAAHLWRAPQPQMQMAPPPQDRDDMDRNRDRDRDRDMDRDRDQGGGRGDMIRQRGFQDGMLGALHDMENNRRPDPDNREELRNPDVPYPMLDGYRDGFRRGYRVAMSEFTGEDFRGLDRGQGNEFRRQGFQEGFEGAIKDFGNQRRPNPNNRDEFRRPNAPYPMWNAYREAFRRGYDRAIAQLTGWQREGDRGR